MTKYMELIKESFDNYDYPVFTLTDVRVLLNGTGVSRRYLKILVNQLIRKRRITRISRGTYTFHDDIAVVGFAFRPFYYGLEDALSYRNFWTQSTNPIVLTENAVREGMRNFRNANYIVKRIRPGLFFGFDFVKHGELWLPVSDAEKTLIDLVYYKHGIRKDALGPLLEAIDRDRLEGYLKFYGRRLRKEINSVLRSAGH